MKSTFSLLSLLALTASAQEHKTPSNNYTELKNSSYITNLEKKRSVTVDERKSRVVVRDYMLYKRDGLK